MSSTEKELDWLEGVAAIHNEQAATGFANRIRQHIQSQAARIEALEESWELLVSWGCENYITGIGSCFRNGRTADAKDTADRACAPCIANHALARIESNE